MLTFEKLYQRLGAAAVKNRTHEEVKEIKKHEFDPHHLDCLLNPRKYPPVIKLADCRCKDTENCAVACFFGALEQKDGKKTINKDLCTGCCECISQCRHKTLIENKEVIPVFDAIYNYDGPVYAMIAPAFISQFSYEVTPGKLRHAFKKLGFAGMLEVALFADILTLKEALEFDRRIKSNEDFLLTSCCCPLWIAMIRKVCKQYMPNVPGSVSPMVACGRTIKYLEPTAKTVFIGPCIAKKAEAREPDIADAVDYVLTFQEMKQIFEFTGINPAELQEDERDHSSRTGRIYARTGGVSEAVAETVKRLNPGRAIEVKARQADGVPDCRRMLEELTKGEMTANFLEGMGCKGGCVGGPRTILDRHEGRENVQQYGKQAVFNTPLDNPYVMELLKRLGFKTVESLIDGENMFSRKF
ncbi:MAG TPA: iron hydrogenase [Clostridiales bacterium]|nr:iron hydrogenase [Clostridiales bacterium]